MRQRQHRQFLLFLLVATAALTLGAIPSSQAGEFEETVYGYGWGYTAAESEAMALDDADQQVASMDSMYESMGGTKTSETIIDIDTVCWPGDPEMGMPDWYDTIVEVFLVYQVPDEEEAADTLTVTVTTAPASPVIIGTTVTHSFTTTGTAPFVKEWSRRCGGGDTPWMMAAGDVSPYQWCAEEEGTHQIRLRVTDANGDTGEDIATVEVQGPDRLVATSVAGDTNASTGPGTPMVVTHRFTARRGATDVGPCWDTTAYEWAAYRRADGTWEPDAPDDVTTWDAGARGHAGANSDDSPQYYFHSPDIIDTKVFVDPGIDWAATPVGTAVQEYRQWVAVRVPVCGDDTMTERFVVSGPFHFIMRTRPGQRIRHELQP